MDFDTAKFMRNDPLKHHLVNWKTAYESGKIMGVAVEFRESSRNFTAALPGFPLIPNSKTLQCAS